MYFPPRNSRFSIHIKVDGFKMPMNSAASLKIEEVAKVRASGAASCISLLLNLSSVKADFGKPAETGKSGLKIMKGSPEPASQER